MSTRLRVVSALAVLSGASFALTGVLLPAVTASRASAQDDLAPPAAGVAISFSAAQAAPAATPQPPAPAAASIQAAPVAPLLPPLPPTPAAAGGSGYTVVAVPGGADNFYVHGRVHGPQMWPGMDPEQVAEMQKNAEEDGKLEGEVRSAVGRYHGTEDAAERDKLRAQVGELLGKQFGLRQQRRTFELESLEARVKKLRDALNKRESARQTIVERRLGELLHDDDGLGWGDPGPGADNAFRFTPAGVNFVQPPVAAPAPARARQRPVQIQGQ